MPAPGLPGAGPDLAAALQTAVAGIPALELSQASRGRLVEMAIAAEKIKAWATHSQAAATTALIEQFETGHDATGQRDRELARDQARHQYLDPRPPPPPKPPPDNGDPPY